jgi:hypothetical protein
MHLYKIYKNTKIILPKLLFHFREDAIKAKNTVTHCDGRKIHIDFADAKKTRKLPKGKGKEENEEENKQEGMYLPVYTFSFFFIFFFRE